MKSRIDRSKKLAIRVSAEEREMLNDLARESGLTCSTLLRSHIRRAFAEAFPKEESAGLTLVRGGKKP